MTDYVSDKEQVELIRKWWKKYGNFILIGVAVGLVVGFGWRFLQQYQIRQSNNASVIYQALLSEQMAHQNEIVARYTEQLTQEYPKTPYASLAQLLSAAQAVQKGDMDLALKSLNWVVDHSRVSMLRQLARLRAARIFIAQGKPQLALGMLNKIEESGYLPVIHQLQGQAYLIAGDKKRAQQLFSQASQEYNQKGMTNSLLDMQLSN